MHTQPWNVIELKDRAWTINRDCVGRVAWPRRYLLWHLMLKLKKKCLYCVMKVKYTVDNSL